MSQAAKAKLFRSLHMGGDPLTMFNIWDPGSAKTVGEVGAKALATGSWSVAAASGFTDGEKVPIALVLENARRIVGAVDLPLSLDIESGYGASPDEVAETLSRVAATGVVGCNLEDSFPHDGSMRSASEQVERLTAARHGVNAICKGFFINARTDVFFQTSPEKHDEAMADEAIDRANAYAASGADGFFVPGLISEALIERVCKASPLPVNVMIGEGSPTFERLKALGVSRISHGPGPYLAAMRALGDAARSALAPPSG